MATVKGKNTMRVEPKKKNIVVVSRGSEVYIIQNVKAEDYETSKRDVDSFWSVFYESRNKLLSALARE